MFAKPLISTEVGSGTSHVNIDGETGIVVTPGSASALRSAMDVLANDESKSQQMGVNARRRFEENFTGKKWESDTHEYTNPSSAAQVKLREDRRGCKAFTAPHNWHWTLYLGTA